jgi:hypothetical protein
MSNMGAAIAAVLTLPAPCDECEEWVRCKNLKLACEDFVQYVAFGVCIEDNRQPTAGNYFRLYNQRRRNR